MSAVDEVLKINYCPDCGAVVENDVRSDNEPLPVEDFSHRVTTRAKVECTECSFSKWASRSSPVPADSRFAVEDIARPNLTDWLP